MTCFIMSSANGFQCAIISLCFSLILFSLSHFLDSTADWFNLFYLFYSLAATGPPNIYRYTEFININGNNSIHRKLKSNLSNEKQCISFERKKKNNKKF